MRGYIILVASLGILWSSSIEAEGSFMEEFPDLEKHLYQEEPTNIYFGIGLSPIGLQQNNSLIFSVELFQLHFINEWIDWELISFGIGKNSGSRQFAESVNYIIRMTPKWRVLSFLSVGVLVGYEFVSFPNLDVKLSKIDQETRSKESTKLEHFSEGGLILGVSISELYSWNEGKNFIKLNQQFYWQTYPTDVNSRGWEYDFTNEEFAADEIEAGFVFVLEIALLF